MDKLKRDMKLSMSQDSDIQQRTFEFIESLIRAFAADLDKGKRKKRLGELFEILCCHLFLKYLLHLP